MPVFLDLWPHIPFQRMLFPSQLPLSHHLFLWFWPSGLPLIRILMIILSPPRCSRIIFHFTIFNYICKVPLAYKVTFSGSRDSDVGMVRGPLFSLPYHLVPHVSHSFIHRIFIEQELCTSYYGKWWRNRSKNTDKVSAFHGVYTLVERTRKEIAKIFQNHDIHY